MSTEDAVEAAGGVVGDSGDRTTGEIGRTASIWQSTCSCTNADSYEPSRTAWSPEACRAGASVVAIALASSGLFTEPFCRELLSLDVLKTRLLCFLHWTEACCPKTVDENSTFDCRLV